MRRLLLLANGLAALLLASCGEDQPVDDGVTDILLSPECAALCQRIETTCAGFQCDPESVCDTQGACLAEKRADLACQADPKRTQLTCLNMGGYSTVGVCPDNSKRCR